MRSNIDEITNDEAIERYTSRFFRPVYVETPVIPVSYDGKYVLLCAVAVDVETTENQMDQLETSIENIVGVHKAFCLIGPARIPIDRVPDGCNLHIGVEGKFEIRPIVVES